MSLLLLGAGKGVDAPASPQDILTIQDAHGICLITTAAPHGLTTTDTISVSGNSISGYNVTHGIIQTPTTTTLETDVPYTADGTGGTWTLV